MNGTCRVIIPRCSLFGQTNFISVFLQKKLIYFVENVYRILRALIMHNPMSYRYRLLHLKKHPFFPNFKLPIITKLYKTKERVWVIDRREIWISLGCISCNPIQVLDDIRVYSRVGGAGATIRPGYQSNEFSSDSQWATRVTLEIARCLFKFNSNLN